MSANPTPANAGIAITGMAGRFPGAPTPAQLWENVRAGAVLESFDEFDASFFECTPREAEIMDPQHRLMLQCAWGSLEDAGQTGDRRDSLVGVFVGSGSDKDSLASTISDKLNLTGPSVVVQTFCSTSLVAVHLACQSLLVYECDVALAGGVAIQVPQGQGARGSVTGSGVGVVVLRRLEDALRDRDQVYAVILGSAVNNDGGVRAGNAVPALDGQAAVIAEAMAHAGVAPETIGYIELDRAAGVTGLIKTVQALRHGWLPQGRDWPRGTMPRRAGVSSFGLDGTNAHVVLEEAPERSPSSAARPCEVILLSAKTLTALDALTDRLVTHLRAPDTPALGDVAFTLQTGRCGFNHRRMVVGQTAADVAAALATQTARVFTCEQTQRGRPVAFLFPGLGDQYAGMARALYDHEPSFRAALDECAALATPHLGLDLRDVIYPPSDPDDGVAHAIDGDLDLRAMLRRGRIHDDRSRLSRLTRTRVTQPAVFAAGYALARYLRHWGIEPAAVIGHSLGEYIAATVAGVFSLTDAMRVVCFRAELIDRLPQGAMLAVAASAREVMPLAGDEIDLAAVNGDRAIVLAGPVEAVARAHARLTAIEIPCLLMETTHAFHSRMLVDAQKPLTELLRSIALHPPQVRCVSNVSGTWLSPREATDPDYWARHMCSTVYFSDGLECLLDESEMVLLEVGPGQSLGSFTTQHPSCGSDRISSILSTIPLVHHRQSDFAFFQTTLGKLWLAGVDIDWRRGRAHEHRGKVSLPTHPLRLEALE